MSKKRIVRSYAVKGGDRVVVGLVVFVWEDDGIHYAFAPSLDITGYGKSEGQAKASLDLMLDEFMEYTHNKGTIYKELERLGWTMNKKKKRLRAPEHAELLADNEDYREIAGRLDVRSEKREVAFAL
ncbi:MAG: hypothetical protein IPJ76_13845 [Flavobacteriales bacterium]|nr:MAG: hypothetical protein IPJ76_13845 [Flavobacteriales bacterium]